MVPIFGADAIKGVLEVSQGWRYARRVRPRSTLAPNPRIAFLPGAAGERALIARLVAGDELAYRECYEMHAPRTLRVLLRMLGDRAKAEDVLQETFVAAFKKIGQFRGDAQLGTWITGIA